MLKSLVLVAVGVAFGMSKYGKPTVEWLKTKLTAKYDIVSYPDGTYAIRLSWAGVSLYRNLKYTGEDPVEKWHFKGNDRFDTECKGTLEECQALMKTKEENESETVVDAE